MKINLNETMYQLLKKDEKLKTIFYELGFTDIVKPMMLNTAGRVMTLKAGASFKKIALTDIIEKLKENGYEVEDNNE